MCYFLFSSFSLSLSIFAFLRLILVSPPVFNSDEVDSFVLAIVLEQVFGIFEILKKKFPLTPLKLTDVGGKREIDAGKEFV